MSEWVKFWNERVEWEGRGDGREWERTERLFGGIKVCSGLNRAECASQQNSEAMPEHGRNL